MCLNNSILLVELMLFVYYLEQDLQARDQDTTNPSFQAFQPYVYGAKKRTGTTISNSYCLL